MGSCKFSYVVNFYWNFFVLGEDPLQGDFPEVIEEYLEYGVMKCIAFNRRGTLLAGNFLSVLYFFIFFSHGKFDVFDCVTTRVVQKL